MNVVFLLSVPPNVRLFQLREDVNVLSIPKHLLPACRIAARVLAAPVNIDKISVQGDIGHRCFVPLPINHDRHLGADNKHTARRDRKHLRPISGGDIAEGAGAEAQRSSGQIRSIDIAWKASLIGYRGSEKKTVSTAILSNDMIRSR